MSSKQEPVYRQLNCKLEEHEVLQRSNQQAAKWEEFKRNDEEAKASAAGYKGKKVAIQGELDRLGHAVQNRAEMRAVECRWYHHTYLGTKSLVRMDTGESVETVDLTEKEKQGSLQFEPATTFTAGGRTVTATDEVLEQALERERTHEDARADFDEVFKPDDSSIVDAFADGLADDTKLASAELEAITKEANGGVMPTEAQLAEATEIGERSYAKALAGLPVHDSSFELPESEVEKQTGRAKKRKKGTDDALPV